ncbi:MAG: vanadium-dependent haloperoxidase [Burkholderiales bacterium]
MKKLIPRRRWRRAPGLLIVTMALAAWHPATQGATPPPVSAPRADAYSAAVATEWFSLALKLVQQTPGNSPPVASRALAYLSLALYESTVPGMPEHRSLAGQLNELNSLPWAQPDEPLHWPTVANAALATMTRMMHPNASAENKARIDLLERELPVRLGGDFNPAMVSSEVGNRSQTFGRLMAMALMTWARTDGGHEAWGPLRRNQTIYVPPSGPGQWTPTPPSFQPALLPWWGKVRSFAPANTASCAAPPPPPYSDATDSPFHAEALEVYHISNEATQQQRQFALYWADDPGKTPTPAGHWAYITTDLLRTRHATLAEAAETYVKLNLAMADAFIAAWRTKYERNLLRPVTYIQQALDRHWVPTLMDTPPFPEFPSGHSVQSSAAAQVLEQIFGADTSFVDNTHNDRGWGPRQFPSFRAAAAEAAVSRLYAGIHFRSGVEAGVVQGECVARNILALKFQP